MTDTVNQGTARVLDLGSGDGRLLSAVLSAVGSPEAVALDFPPAMLARLRARFSGQANVGIVPHDMDLPLPASLGTFDAIVPSFAIHHLVHERKRALHADVFERLKPGDTP